VFIVDARRDAANLRLTTVEDDETIVIARLVVRRAPCPSSRDANARVVTRPLKRRVGDALAPVERARASRDGTATTRARGASENDTILSHRSPTRRATREGARAVVRVTIRSPGHRVSALRCEKKRAPRRGNRARDA
jgi:hypothetical protein